MAEEKVASKPEDGTYFTVIWPGGMAIREAKDPDSKSLGIKAHNAVIHGKREGNWVALTQEPGYILLADADGTMNLQLHKEKSLEEVEPPIVASPAEKRRANLRVGIMAVAFIGALVLRLGDFVQSAPGTAQDTGSRMARALGESSGAVSQADIVARTSRARFPPADPSIIEKPLPEPADPDGVFAEALRVLEESYKGPDEALKNIGAFSHDKAKREVKKAVGSEKPAVYGEIHSATALAMLEHIGAKPGQKYYDLGSGTGKTVALAWLLGLEATGVELVKARWSTSCDALTGLRERTSGKPLRGDGTASLRNIKGSLLDADLVDADIIFADSVMFSEDMMDGIARMVKGLKPGTLLITSNRPDLPPDGLKLLQRFTGQSSWANESVWKVHEVTGDAIKGQIAVRPPAGGAVIKGAMRCAMDDPVKAAKDEF